LGDLSYTNIMNKRNRYAQSSKGKWYWRF